MPYPPYYSNMPVVMVRAMSPLEIRAREVVAYAEETEPWPEEFGTPQFMDCNLSMQYLIGNGDKAIFQIRCPTIAASTKIWARVQLSESEKKLCYFLGGC